MLNLGIFSGPEAAFSPPSKRGGACTLDDHPILLSWVGTMGRSALLYVVASGLESSLVPFRIILPLEGG